MEVSDWGAIPRRGSWGGKHDGFGYGGDNLFCLSDLLFLRRDVVKRSNAGHRCYLSR